jgi:hypothetical protein
MFLPQKASDFPVKTTPPEVFSRSSRSKYIAFDALEANCDEILDYRVLYPPQNLLQGSKRKKKHRSTSAK